MAKVSQLFYRSWLSISTEFRSTTLCLTSENSRTVNLFLIDAIGPFFRGYKRKKINWSKIPFEHLHTESPLREQQFKQIRADLNEFVEKVSSIGYNAVTLDDVVHLADHPVYEDEVRRRIAVFRDEFRKLFVDIKQNGLSIFITMDILATTPALRAYLDDDAAKTQGFLIELLDGFLTDFPEVSGVIIRVGESDGLDVKSDFKSELYFKTPRALNQCLKALLPVFEGHGKKLILRTWTVGAYRLGDLIWHRGKLAKVLEGIDSPAFVLSMKHGESDFFRYLPLNKNFFRTPVQKIIELQTKREYEGCGEFPAFIGHEHEHFAQELSSAENLIGVSVWCQSGGWVPFRRLAYIGNGSIWTEINTEITIRIFREQQSVEQAVLAIWGESRSGQMLEFLRLSEEVVQELYYHSEFARQKLFFRRVRIPPLIGVYWNTVFINNSLRKLLLHFSSDGEASIREAQTALKKIQRMKKLARELELPLDDITYMQHTFGILALARKYFYGAADSDIKAELKAAKKRYKKTYPKGTRSRYAIRLNFRPFKLRPSFIGWSVAILLRKQRGYRLIDYVFSLYLTSFFYWLISRTNKKLIPKFARKSAMGVETIFK